jgi:hypothetical protein
VIPASDSVQRILPEELVLGGVGNTQCCEKRLPKVSYCHSPCLHCVSRNKLLFEGNKSTILIVLLCAASGAELQLEPFELFSEIGDLQIAMRPRSSQVEVFSTDRFDLQIRELTSKRLVFLSNKVRIDRHLSRLPGLFALCARMSVHRGRYRYQ